MRCSLLVLVVLRLSQSDGEVDLTSGLNAAIEDCEILWTEVSKDPDFKERFEQPALAGKGANGCVWFATDTENDGVKVAVKVSKQADVGRIVQWKGECAQTNILRLNACEASQKGVKPESDLLALSEAFHPNCLDVDIAEGYPFMVQHAAPTDPIRNVGRWGEPIANGIKLSKADQKYVFAQFIAAVYGLHGIGTAHNDLHGENILLDKKDSSLPLALIDFSDSSPMVDASKINYKRDGIALYMWTAHLADCPPEATIKRMTTSPELRQVQAEFSKCLKEKWGVDDDFLQAFAAIIEADAAEDPDQHVKALYQTSFVQDILNAKADKWKQPRYHWKEAEDCLNWKPAEFQRKRDQAIYGDKYKCDTIPTFKSAICPAANPIACFSLVKNVPWSCQPTSELDPNLRCATVGLPQNYGVDDKFYDGLCIRKEHRGYKYAMKYGKSKKKKEVKSNTKNEGKSSTMNEDTSSTKNSGKKDTAAKEPELRNLKWRWAEHKIPGVGYYVPRMGIGDKWNMPADRAALAKELEAKIQDPQAGDKDYKTRSVEIADADYPERRKTFANYAKALDWLKSQSNIQSREDL